MRRPGHAIDRNLELWTANLERTVIAEVGDRPAGYAMWTDDGRESTLITFNVAVEHRRSGIGGQLMGTSLTMRVITVSRR